jgi:hypothetical protein
MCGCLRFNHSSRFKLEDLSIHRFLLHNDSSSRIELNDLMRLVRSEKGNVSDPIVKKAADVQLNNIIQSVDIILSNCHSVDMPIIN